METPQTNTAPGRIKWLAVAAGFLLDNLISILIVGIAARFEPDLATTILLTTTAGLITACLLVLSTGIGGYLAARLARTEHVLHGVLVGGMGIFVMLVQGLISGQAQPVDRILLQCVAVGVGGIGGWMSGRMPAARP